MGFCEKTLHTEKWGCHSEKNKHAAYMWQKAATSDFLIISFNSAAILVYENVGICCFRHVIEKKNLKLTAKLKKAYFSSIAQTKLAYIVSGTVFRLFGVKDPYRPVLSTILCCFWDFCNIHHHINGVSN